MESCCRWIFNYLKNYELTFSPLKDFHKSKFGILTKRYVSYRKQSFDLHSKSNYWFFYGMHWAEMVKKHADQIMFFQQCFWLQTKKKPGSLNGKKEYCKTQHRIWTLHGLTCSFKFSSQ